LVAVAAPLAGQRPAAPPAARPAFKGIFEPVPFPADVALNDVFFVTPEVGWATGGNANQNGVIIGTKDAGATWEVQLGDPESTEYPYSQLRFVDGRIGFAGQSAPTGDDRLLRTLDGENWKMVGTLLEHRTDFAFISATVGVQAFGEKILRTEDAGRTWKQVMECRIKVQAGGLTRDARCYVENFHFPTRRVGYGIGYSPDAPGVYFAKTEDGGASWKAWMVLPEERGREAHFFFTDANHGSACLYGGKLVVSDDGGQTWSAASGPACDGKPEVRFADPEVGWTAVYGAINFSLDGGRRWSGREVKLPALINAFSLPRRDRAFVVGDHGMVYRYRVVPASEPVPPTVIVGPAMPSQSPELDQRVAELDATIAALRQAVAAAPDGAASAPSGATPNETAAEPAPADPTLEEAPLPSPELPEASPFTTSCCGKPQGRTKLLLGAIIAALPQLLEKQRNTNTLGGSLLWLVELPLKVTGLRNAVAGFWKAPDKGAAQQALTDLSAAAEALKASTAMVFQRTPAQIPGDAGASASSAPPAPAPVEGAAAAAAPADRAEPDSAATGPNVTKAAAKAAKKGIGGLIKKKVKIP
jgi:photosystem II stability/assembly factor-like uncharacterized protein